jgi:hypothetical protein
VSSAAEVLRVEVTERQDIPEYGYEQIQGSAYSPYQRGDRGRRQGAENADGLEFSVFNCFRAGRHKALTGSNR